MFIDPPVGQAGNHLLRGRWLRISLKQNLLFSPHSSLLSRPPFPFFPLACPSLFPGIPQILYESVPTWSGRVAMRADTVHMAAFTINPMEKSHHIVWQVPNLPFDCRRIQTVPRPLGMNPFKSFLFFIFIFYCEILLIFNKCVHVHD